MGGARLKNRSNDNANKLVITLLLLNNIVTTRTLGGTLYFSIGGTIGDCFKNVYDPGIDPKLVEVYLGGGQVVMSQKFLGSSRVVVEKCSHIMACCKMRYARLHA